MPRRCKCSVSTSEFQGPKSTLPPPPPCTTAKDEGVTVYILLLLTSLLHSNAPPPKPLMPPSHFSTCQESIVPLFKLLLNLAVYTLSIQFYFPKLKIPGCRLPSGSLCPGADFPQTLHWGCKC